MGQFIARANRASKFAVRPFLGAMALYFDIFKDCTFAILIYTSWIDQCEKRNGDNLNQSCLYYTEYSFESAVIVILIFVIALVQVSIFRFIIIYLRYLPTIFFNVPGVIYVSDIRDFSQNV